MSINKFERLLQNFLDRAKLFSTNCDSRKGVITSLKRLIWYICGQRPQRVALALAAECHTLPLLRSHRRRRTPSRKARTVNGGGGALSVGVSYRQYMIRSNDDQASPMVAPRTQIYTGSHPWCDVLIWPWRCSSNSGMNSLEATQICM